MVHERSGGGTTDNNNRIRLMSNAHILLYELNLRYVEE